MTRMPPLMGQPPDGQVYNCHQCGCETDEFWAVIVHGILFCSDQCSVDYDKEYLGGDDDDQEDCD